MPTGALVDRRSRPQRCRRPTWAEDLSSRHPGLVCLNNRYHHPTLGAFISVDPLVVATGEAYAYTSGNPVSFSDPSGLEECYVGTGICWGAGDPQPARPAPPPGTQDPCDTTGGGGAPCRVYTVSPAPESDPLPWWIPDEVRGDALDDPLLAGQLWFLDDISSMSLDEFEDLWREADVADRLDWSNDGCSDRNVVTNGSFGCIRHDFVYRNQRRIDSLFNLEGRLRGNNGLLKRFADEQLASDVAVWWDPVSWLAAPLVYAGVTTLGGSYYDAWNKPDVGRSVYGNDSRVVTPDRGPGDIRR